MRKPRNPRKPRSVWSRVCLFFLIMLFCPAATARGQDNLPLVSPSVILVEQTTGKVLYGKNEYARMYPASMTKILTALVTLDYLAPEDVLLVGNEIYGMPPGYNTALHFEGESITVHNLLRALMIRSGNETGCILALNVIRAKEERQKIPYEEAERMFCSLMDEKARSLGAKDSHFTNPYGLHDINHYSTAYDLALVARAYMENAVLREIVAERSYTGDSLDGLEIEGAKTQIYTWDTHNELLMGGSNAYPYATGIKTGFHDDAGDCVTASAEKRGVELVAVIFNSPDPGRWQDARVLFDYGYETFAFETIQEKDKKLDTVVIANPRLGETDKLDVLTNDEVVDFFSKDEISRIECVLTYDPLFVAPPPEDESDADPDPEETPPVRLLAPIEKDAPLGTVKYILDGTVIFEGAFRAAESVTERTLDSDMDYYMAQFTDNVFTLKALPYWFGGAGLMVGIIGIVAAIAGNRRRRDYWRGGRYR